MPPLSPPECAFRLGHQRIIHSPLGIVDHAQWPESALNVNRFQWFSVIYPQQYRGLSVLHQPRYGTRRGDPALASIGLVVLLDVAQAIKVIDHHAEGLLQPFGR